MLVRVTLAYLCAGVVVRDGAIVEAAPVLRWSVGRSLEYLAAWALKKNGTVEVVTAWERQ